uniref:KHDRBS Qua1 domain-containing protein n=1 Tax=Moschus moschiferus TaxID=68415 RepID=A0A8C6E0F2_MOSMO
MEEKYLPELMAEKDSLDPSFVHASRLLAEEIEKFQGSDVKNEDEEEKYLDVISNKNIKLSERVLIPVKQYPKQFVKTCSINNVLVHVKMSILL